MTKETTTLLKNVNSAVSKALDDARRRRNEEDRKFIVSSIGRDLTSILSPLLAKIAENARLTRDEISSIISDIKVDAPSVSVNSETPKAEVEVKVDIPEIKTTGIEKAIKIAMSRIKIKAPDVTVNTPEVKMPKEMEVKGIKGYVKKLFVRLDKPFEVVFDREDVQRTVLVDTKGKPYKALDFAVGGGGGGGRGVVTITKATSSKLEQLLLADVTKWYTLTMPSSMTSLDMFLNEQGALCYYRWDNPEDETQPRMPIFPGYSRRMVDAKFGGRKMYVTSTTANQTIVVEYFLGE